MRGGFIALTGWCDGVVSIGDDVAPDCEKLVASLDIHGDLRWFYALPDTCGDAHVVAADEDGGAAIGLAGQESACVDLGDGHLLTGDSFLVRLDPQGQWVWGLGFEGGGYGTMYGASIAFDAQGATILASSTGVETLDFGRGAVPGGGGEGSELFLARFTP